MNNAAYPIPVLNLALSFIPCLVVIVIYIRWALKAQTVVLALIRMVIQLILVGFALNAIFLQENVFVISMVVLVMLAISAWIALRPLAESRKVLYRKTLMALLLGGVPVLLLVTKCVIHLDPWYFSRFMIPLAGMIFANNMNSVSLCAERFFSERQRGVDYVQARNAAYNAALLPLLNSLFAVGLVSLPGMMTGQILSGVSPLSAVRYQIVVMSMLFGSSGICAAAYLFLNRK